MKTHKTLNLLSVLFNLAIIGLTVYSVMYFFTHGAEGNMTGFRFTALRYYTVLSNLFCSLCSLPVLIGSIRLFIAPRSKKGNARIMKKTPLTWKLVGTTCITVTLLVVLFILTPVFSLKVMMSGKNFFLHGLNPVLAIISYIAFDRGHTPGFRHIFTSVLPTVCYGVVYAVMVLVVKKWDDFYGFTRIQLPGMEDTLPWYCVAAGLLVAVAFVALILNVLHALFNRTRRSI